MTRLLSMIISFLIGRAAHSDGSHSSGLIKLPMLMLRKITQLWLVGLGVLLVGVVGVALLLLEVSQQLQLQHYIVFTSSMALSLGVIAVSLGTCALVLRKSLWTSNEDIGVSTKSPEPDQSDLGTMLALIAKDFLDERIKRREEPPAAVSPAMNVAELKKTEFTKRPIQPSAVSGHII